MSCMGFLVIAVVVITCGPLSGVLGQTVVVLEGRTAQFNDMIIDLDIGGSSVIVLTAQGDQMMQLDIFNQRVFPDFRSRLKNLRFNSGFNQPPSVSFTLENVRKSDAGNFLCQTSFGGSGTPQSCGTATLVVAGRPTKPTFSALTNPVLVGNDVILACQATSTSVPPSSALKLVYNLKENGRLALSQPAQVSRFKLSSVSKAKTGTRYSCVAYELNTLTNQLTGLQSPDSDVYTMNPLYPPAAAVFAPTKTNYLVSSGDSIPDVTCTADCNPACNVDWYKDSQIFQDGGTLTLGKTDKTDAGNYFCRAKNSVGSKDKPLIISVQDSVSSPKLIPPTTEYNVPEGTPLDDIFCKATCTPTCSFSWLKDGEKLLESQGIRLGSVGAKSSGKYTCLASNGEDTSEVSFVLNVQYPPRDPAGRELISPSANLYKVEEGALVLPDISCVADCNPPCTVQWTKTGLGPVSSGSPVLSLGAASRDDTGNYTCTASNSLGSTSDTVEVMIEFRPEQLSLTPPKAQYESVEDIDVIPDVRCQAVCNPPCSYEWYKGSGGTPLSDTAFLSLGRVSRTLEGTYTCRAKNKVGEATKSFDVVVLYGPIKATIQPPQDSYTVPAGTLLPAISCGADCNPSCRYKWVKDDSLDAITTSRTLTIGQADPKVAGIYKCIVSNDYGSANTKFDLDVQFGPSSTITLNPADNVHDLSEGEDLTVTCDATCDPACDFKWENGQGEGLSGGRTLQLFDVEKQNAGQYTCLADNGVGTPARRTIVVNVLIGPSGRVSITPPGPTIKLKQGNSIVLTCAAECSPACTFKWLQDSRELPSRTGILTLNDVVREQNGAYRCEANNSVGTASKEVVVDVLYGPGNSIAFDPDKASHPVEENSDLRVTCVADCEPECEYVWKRGSAQVASGSVLLLSNVQRNQAGSYSCTADNAVKQPATGQISVDVTYGPDELKFFPDVSELFPAKGTTVFLKCWATCNPECAYTWYKGSSLLPDATKGELDLRNITIASSGNYQCVANNNVGDSATRTVDISVRAGPGTTIRFNPPDDTAVVMEGRRFKVDCIAQCSPSCAYEWRKGPKLITDTATLEFPATDREKAGSYICFASNDADSQASKPLSLEVQYGPGNSTHLFPPGETQSYVEGAPFNVKCAAECHPPCEYKWFLGTSVLPYEDGVLFSDSAQLDQAGTYTCQASNGIGSATSTSVTIDIKTGPGSTISFTPPGDQQVIKEGESLAVTCSADCSPACTYKWMFNTQELPTQSGRLQLDKVMRDQKGVYTCVADNGFGNQGSKPLTVDVQYGPMEGAIDLFPTDSTQVLNEGASIALKCSVDCSPECSYTWYLGNEVVASKDGVLSLVAVGPVNAGTYRCSASNSIGLASSDVITVVVQTGPGNTVKIEPPGDMYNVTEGKQLQMRCSAVCSPPCTYTWYYGFERVKSDDGQLSIPGVQRNMSGPFVCYAANDVGLQGSRLIQVDVQYGPVEGVEVDPADSVSVVAGSPFSLRCSANCHPPCDYAWYQGPQPREEGGKLIVKKATDAEGGSYTCRASNDLGSEVSDVVNVEVQYGPRDTIRLEPDDPVYLVQEEDDVVVTCSADCKPECEYIWYAGSKQVESDRGRLVIPAYDRSRPRFYSCFADNGISSRAMAPLQIEVQYGPGDKPTLFPDTSPLVATVGGSISVQCSAKCSPGCNYTWTRDGQEVPSTSGVLQLRNLKLDQAGTYVCSAGNGVGPGPTSASVDIELQSGSGASIRFVPPSLTATVPEGNKLEVKCLANCVPECDYLWIIDGRQVSSRSELLLTNTQKNQAGVYQCNARNDLGVNVTQQLTVTVEHGPGDSVKLFPPQGARNLNRGETLSVQCSAFCTPPCDYKWRKGSDDLATEEGVLLLPNVTPDDKGRYTCTADNRKGPPRSVDLTVNVNFGPEDTVVFNPPGQEATLKEGDTLQVRCSAQCLPTCTYTWYLSSRRLNTTGGTLVIPALTRQDAGTYTCHADNGVGRRMSRELLVDVEFPPNTPTFDPATTSYTLRERIDSVSDIRCYTDCNPRCDVKWLKNGQPVATVGNVLALPTPERSADGKYTCVVSNKHGTRQKDLTIKINYAPSIAIFTINDKKTVATVQEKYPVTLNCRVSSQPPSTIQIYNDTEIIQEDKDTLQSKYSWKQAECLDAGTYSCTADNGVGALVSLSAELQVLCAPRLDPRVFKQLLVAAEQGQTAVITVPALGNPAPSFLWYKVRNGVPSVILEGSNDTQGQSDKFFTVNGTSSTLTIENVQLADFGDYVISMANDLGSSNITFSLVPQSAPYKARNLTTRPIDPHTVEVSWSPGFNGGAKQQFLLEYLKRGTSGWRTLELDPRINDVTRSISLNVSDLNPSTRYAFRLRSRNVFGLSDYSGESKVLTPASADYTVATGDVNPTPILLGVGLALGFLVGAGITAIVVVSRCRPKTGKHGENTIDDFRSDTTYDTLYLRDALWAQRHIKLRQNGGMEPLDGYDYKQPQDTMRTSL